VALLARHGARQGSCLDVRAVGPHPRQAGLASPGKGPWGRAGPVVRPTMAGNAPTGHGRTACRERRWTTLSTGHGSEADQHQGGDGNGVTHAFPSQSLVVGAEAVHSSCEPLAADMTTVKGRAFSIAFPGSPGLILHSMISRSRAAWGRATILALNPWIHVALLVTASLLPYSGSLRAPFTFDDQRCIVDNPAIRSFEYFTSPASGRPAGVLCGTGPRIVGLFSFAVNYAIGGIDVTGFHVFNLAVHLACTLLVYAFIRLTIRTPAFRKPRTELASMAGSGPLIALLAALLFACHPVQTQAVTYVTQRFTSLATMLYLLSSVLYVRFRNGTGGAPGRFALYVGSVLAAVLAMFTKEIAFTLPFALALHEPMFGEGKRRTRWLSLAPFFATLVIIPFTILAPTGGATTLTAVDDTLRGLVTNTRLSRFEYVTTQIPVTSTYLRLLLLPVGQNLDYDHPIHRSLLDPEVVLSGSIVLAIVAFGVWLFLRSRYPQSRWGPEFRLASFGIGWFFLNLTLEATAVPLPDVIFEHRLYLPSVGFFLAIAALVVILRDKLRASLPLAARAVVPLFMACVAALTWATYARNAIWSDPVLLWEDVAAKSPRKPRAFIELGALHAKSGNLDEATLAIENAIRVAPDLADPYNTLGVIRKREGRTAEAMQNYQTALRLRPDFAEVHNNIGILLSSGATSEEAAAEFQEAIRLKPDYAEAHNNLGVLRARQGRWSDAIREFEAALRINPSHAAARANLTRASHAASGQ